MYGPNVKEFVKFLRLTRAHLTHQILASADDEKNQEKIAQLSLSSRRLFDQIMMLEDPESYIKMLNRKARWLLEDAEDEKGEEKRNGLFTEARAILAKAEEATLLRNQIPKVTKGSLKKVEGLAAELKRLAGERKKAVENLDQMVDVSAAVLQLTAKVLSMAVLAI